MRGDSGVDRAASVLERLEVRAETTGHARVIWRYSVFRVPFRCCLGLSVPPSPSLTGTLPLPRSQVLLERSVRRGRDGEGPGAVRPCGVHRGRVRVRVRHHGPRREKRGVRGGRVVRDSRARHAVGHRLRRRRERARRSGGADRAGVAERRRAPGRARVGGHDPRGPATAAGDVTRHETV